MEEKQKTFGKVTVHYKKREVPNEFTNLQDAVAEFKKAFLKAVTPILQPIVNGLSKMLKKRV